MTDHPRFPPDSPDGTDETTGLEEPTSAAYVTFSTTPEGHSLTASVLAKETTRTLETVNNVSAVAASVLGPYVLAKPMLAGTSATPWQVHIAALLLMAIAPLIFTHLNHRRG